MHRYFNEEKKSPAHESQVFFCETILKDAMHQALYFNGELRHTNNLQYQQIDTCIKLFFTYVLTIKNFLLSSIRGFERAITYFHQDLLT
jgi:hypothetical protein